MEEIAMWHPRQHFCHVGIVTCMLSHKKVLGSMSCQHPLTTFYVRDPLYGCKILEDHYLKKIFRMSKNKNSYILEGPSCFKIQLYV